MERELIIIIAFLFTGLLEIVISIPLIFEKIPPNYFYGFRVRKTLSNKEIWYKVNKYLGKDFLAAGIILTLGALLLLIFRIEIFTALITGLVLVLFPLSIVVLRGFSYLYKL